MNTRTVGSTGPRVSALGLGAMGMSDLYGPTDDGESIATLHAAIDAGITLIDSGDFYGAGRNELLIQRSAPRPSDQRQVRRLRDPPALLARRPPPPSRPSRTRSPGSAPITSTSTG